MSLSYTSNLKLQKPQLGDTGWSVPVLANYDTLDAIAPIGGLAVTLTETPSASLNVKVSPGNVIAQDGSVASYGGTTSQPITASVTRALYLDGPSSWALSVATTFPVTPHVRLATVSTGATTITSITDARQSSNVAGSILDGTAWSLGLTNGLKIGTATTQRIAFFNATPAAQSTGGSAVASSTYGTPEAALLNKAYAALRTYGLLS